MAIDERTAIGLILFVGVIVHYFWAMQRQLRRLRQGYRPGTRFGYLSGYGALVANLLAPANIAIMSFFALHIAYVLTQDYSLIHLRYGLIGIAISIVSLPVARLLLLPLRIGPSHCNRLLAASWVSILSGLFAFGLWTIIITNGKVLEMRVPESSVNLIMTALIPIVTMVTWMAISYSQAR